MTVNVIAIPDNGWDDYLFNSKCYGIWVYANEEDHNDPDMYKLHFVTYQVFPSAALTAHLEAIEAAAKLEPGYYEDQVVHEYLDEVERSYPEYEFDFIDMDKADDADTLICYDEIDWHEYRIEQAGLTEEWQKTTEAERVAEHIEGICENLRCNGGYPDYIRLALLAEGKHYAVSEFSQYDYRYVEGAVPIVVERPDSGGLLLKTRDSCLTSDYGWSHYTQRYLACTEGEARRRFWSYLQEQGVAAVADE